MDESVDLVVSTPISDDYGGQEENTTIATTTIPFLHIEETGNEITDFLLTPSGILLICVIGIITLSISIKLVLGTLLRYKEYLTISINKNPEKTEPSKEELRQAEEAEFVSHRDKILNLILNHRFYSYIRMKYIELDHDMIFDQYQHAISSGIKHDTVDVVKLKNLVASKFLSDCIFRYLLEVTIKWINEVVTEYKEQTLDDKDRIPISLCNIIEYITHFTKNTLVTSQNIRLSFNDSIIDGIPNFFINEFYRILNQKINVIQEILSQIIYASNVVWYFKVINILDMFEILIVCLKDAIDTSLILMNGEVGNYVDNLNRNRSSFNSGAIL